jgi:hypothetical protein
MFASDTKMIKLAANNRGQGKWRIGDISEHFTAKES